MKKVIYIILLFVFLGLFFVLLFYNLQKNSETERTGTINNDYKEYVSKAPDVKTMIQKTVGEDVEIIDYKTIADSPQSLFCFAVIAHENQKNY